MHLLRLSLSLPVVYSRAFVSSGDFHHQAILNPHRVYSSMHSLCYKDTGVVGHESQVTSHVAWHT